MADKKAAARMALSLSRGSGCHSPFRSIKFFVLCHGILQLSQLMVSGYMKSSVSTIERRFGLTSQLSGLLASFNEVGNTLLIVFVSYFGSRVHRPRLIGCGAALVSLAALLLGLPHFVAKPYRYDRSMTVAPNNSHGAHLCPDQESLEAAGNASCTPHTEDRQGLILACMFLGQALLGIGTVPIQPFGISYIDDFARSNDSPLFLGFLYAATFLGPAVAYTLGAFMLSFYVDIDRMPPEGVDLTLTDPRWVGAWWLGFLISASIVALSAIPYFFFPREMPQEEPAGGPRPSPWLINGDAKIDSKQDLMETSSKQNPSGNLSVVQFIKVFPEVLLRILRHPIFLLVVLGQVCLSATVAGVGTFLPKFLERQFSISASLANMFIGGLSIPSAVVGIVAGGALVKGLRLNLKQCGALGVAGSLFCVLASVPLFFLGCSTNPVADLGFGASSQLRACRRPCECPPDIFDPICGQDGIEYLSPCQAGCRFVNLDDNQKVVNYTQCSCIWPEERGGSALPGSCGSPCRHLLLPFIVLASLGGAVASVTHTPSLMLILRTVNREEKSFAIGIQFLLLRLLAWMPSPVIHGSAIDTTCVRWGWKCGQRASCRYYDHDLFRHRFMGIQMFFKVGAFLSFLLVYFILRRQEDGTVQVPQTGLGSKQEPLTPISQKGLLESHA
ncbi:solute carrier organic anion transporter family member 2B1 isoform X1 [Tachyglossus aculeatus]|uniref:solute carrier organic anion transporter family member 2B1 isoform X1 n=1 Tax=Tachyglossus aculeatus TaxID=9261 RepID=UPI0018F78408|nr:solute carrier organic anion transporter family member 2B1 isoform X1 [Tachyglossus aculeatus]XP_038624499.1 solute carrier organic anion transporter family member 2B1 isoform X1 [Tachyglossus aculeatus]